jgi:methionine sulfoxide reductase heme-binding subunit
MSARYVTVQWTKRKIVYDVFLAIGVAAYLALFSIVGGAVRPDVSPAILDMRAWGSCAFVMFTLVSMIGPLARLDRRWNPLLYNRRHFGVASFLVAAVHAWKVMGFYHAFSDVPQLVSLFTNDAAFTTASWPFPIFGAIALAILFFLAVSSHDFWQRFLGGKAWKWLHMSAYAAYALAVLHVAYGALQLETHWAYASFVGVAAAGVVTLHLIAALRSNRADAKPVTWVDHDGEKWIDAGSPERVPRDRAIPLCVPGAERIALVRHGDRVSAVHGVCAHQGGPLYEGKVIDGCLTCPWHGWQYRPADGQSPPPFVEKIATYRIRLSREGRLLVHPTALPPGTATESVTIEEPRDV